MKRVFALAVLPTAISALLAAGCGSSTSSSSSAKSAASSTATKITAAKPVVITTMHGKLGTFLVAGPKQLTVYLFEADKGSTSNCSGKCAVVWPPVLGKPTASGQALGADLGTTTRSNGATQVTYKGHPLYYFLEDKTAGATLGQGVNGFGAPWYVLSPAGSKIDTGGSASAASGGAAPKPASTSTGSGGGYGY